MSESNCLLTDLQALQAFALAGETAAKSVSSEYLPDLAEVQGALYSLLARANAVHQQALLAQ